MANKKARIKSIHIGNLVQRIMIIIMFAWFLIFLIMPMIMMFGQIFSDNQGNWVGLKNFADYFSNPLMLSSIGHSLTVSNSYGTCVNSDWIVVCIWCYKNTHEA